ncbi:hypothetical protein [Reyranella sp.]|uniref:hypothetical protein n=1 Tax=Reyranella sp. TaxID=1929291 RepID=UPI0011F8B73C|nr:hypothetical protein [Reyranella sp.]TAJ88885.1 MAG: hypothetical protein EPO50_07500 [Reyranella sp.]
MSSSVSSLGVMVQPAALLRLLCALMVALVTVFHVCGTASAREIGPVAVVLDVTGDDGSADDVGMTVEQCHFCSVVPLLATASAIMLPHTPHVVPAAVVAGLLPFSPHADSPPPRALT